MHYVLDNNGRKYLIKEINKFYEHLIEFHTNDGKANNSLHEENGYYFTVTEDFFEKIKKMFNSQNKKP
tara:strand:- start:287 stop:490 length:204 start_codon:yes stop_codon:yes gene_type:complete